MSQAQLAGSDLSDSYVSLIESGRRTPSPAVVAVLAARLGCSVTQLRCGVEDTTLNELKSGLAVARRALYAGHPDQALEQLTRLASRPDLAEATRLRDEVQYSTAQALEALHRFDEAIAVLHRLLDPAGPGGFERAGSSVEADGAGRLGASESLGRAGRPDGMGWGEWATLQVAVARCHRRGGDAAHAARVAGSGFVLAVCAADDGDAEAAEAAVRIGALLTEVLADTGDLLLARQTCTRLLTIAEDSGHPHARLRAYQQAVQVAEITGDLEEAARWAGHALHLLDSDEQLRGATELRTQCAALLLRMRPTHAERARDLLTRQLVDAAVTGATPKTLANLAEAELLLDHPEQAAMHAQRALDAAGADDADVAGVTDRARALSVLAGAWMRSGRHDEALAALVSRAEILERHGPCRQAAHAWLQAADLLGEQPADGPGSDRSETQRLRLYQRALAAMGLRPQIGRPT